MRLWPALALAILLAATANGQRRYETGSYKGFVRENPEVMVVEIAHPLRVSVIKGNVFVDENHPVPEAYFEVRDKRGRVYTAMTDQKGNFDLPNIAPGTYKFKVTKDGFESTIGTIVLSPGNKAKKLQIQLHLGT